MRLVESKTRGTQTLRRRRFEVKRQISFREQYTWVSAHMPILATPRRRGGILLILPILAWEDT